MRVRRALGLAMGATSVLVIALVFLGLMLLGFPRIKQEPETTISVVFDVVKLAFAVAAGVGGVVALVMAYRRQRVAEIANDLAQRTQDHAERVAQDSAYDATERRVTDLYGQAVEQLGHTSAAVRLGGLYSLERLAQDHPQHRQTVIDVVCAYLRMPFRAPRDDEPTGEPSPTDEAANGATLVDDTGKELSGVKQELQVRFAAQRLLARHLAVPAIGEHGDESKLPSAYWKGMRIDLTGATLVDFDLSYCQPRAVSFRKAEFSGVARFTGVCFEEDVEFDQARFTGTAGFGGAQFGGAASFSGTLFADDAGFDRARFTGTAGFGGAKFGKVAGFGGARFGGAAGFGGAKFGKVAGFGGARFDGAAGFGGALFEGSAVFGASQFNSGTRFDGAVFDGDALFDGVSFGGTVWFDWAKFRVPPSYAGAMASYPDEKHVWPAPWHVAPPSPHSRMGQLAPRPDPGHGSEKAGTAAQGSDAEE